MSRVLFISDAHLGDGRHDEAREKKLLSFLDAVEEGDGLYLLGDLFDVWFEYRTVIPKRYFNILFALKRLTLKGVSISFVTGNHDFWVQNFFPDSLGITLYTNDADITIQGFRCFVAHGDGLAGCDFSYRLLKGILRNRFNVGLYRCLHPDIGIPMASWFSRFSRNHQSDGNRDAAYIDFARRKFHEGYNHVILGHTHRPQEYREDAHTYINTGDWMNTFTYGMLKDNQLTLEKWK